MPPTTRKLTTIIHCTILCLSIVLACAPDTIPESMPTQAPIAESDSTKTPIATLTPSNVETLTPTLVPSVTESTCQLLIHGTYNFPKMIDKTFSMGPGIYFFYDLPGGGKYGNDKAGCELNIDCTQLRAINKDSAEANPEGVMGPWVNSLAGEKSSAKWSQYVVTCSSVPQK